MSKFTSVQPQLFFIPGETTTGSVELFPAVWNAAQELVSPQLDNRQKALEDLVSLEAVRLSPLVAYLVASRLEEPDISLRAKITATLADVLGPDGLGRPAPEQVRSYLIAFLGHIRQSAVEAVLEVVLEDSELRGRISRLFNFSPGVGRHLAKILADRSKTLEIRRQAADFIGLVGFVEAAPTLERLRNRLEARQSGQSSMPFAPPSGSDEAQLLPALTTALTLLRS
ncbi:hypothetical protein ACFLYP_01865 [Chloroflexota bacterium]